MLSPKLYFSDPDELMPNAAPTPCRQFGCAALVSPSGYCDIHRKAKQAAQDKQRGSAHARGFGARWQAASKGWLKAHPWCQCSEHQGNSVQHGGVMANVVDHITPHRGDISLFWERSNWQSMAKSCHDKKPAREDGGFGLSQG